jgi:hypothetical protein
MPKIAIMRRMKQTLEMWRFVKVTDATADMLEAISPLRPEQRLSGFLSHTPTITGVELAYQKKYKHAKLSDVRRIYKDAVDNGYIERTVDNNGTLPVDVLRVSAKGYLLTDGWRFFPIGLWNAIFKEYGGFVSFLIGLPTAFGLGVAIHYAMHGATALLRLL